MDIYGKAVASIESTDDDKFGPNGGFTAVLSTPSLDRDGDRLQRDEWQEFTQERYPLDIDHGMSVADTVGSFVPYWDGDRMMMDAHFAGTAKAQDTRALTTPDPTTGIRHISSVSVAFMTDKSKKDGEPRRELLNAGIVAIPSNRDAVILASKAAHALKDAFSDATEGDVPDEVKAAVLEAISPAAETEETKGIVVNVIPKLDEDAMKRVLAEITAKAVGGDGALVQAIHDASSHLGAACAVMEPDVDPDSGADDGANKAADDAEVKEADESALESFEKALDEVLTPQSDSPAEEVPAPAVEAAAATPDAADEDVAPKYAVSAEALRLRILAS